MRKQIKHNPTWASKHLEMHIHEGECPASYPQSHPEVSLSQENWRCYLFSPTLFNSGVDTDSTRHLLPCL